MKQKRSRNHIKYSKRRFFLISAILCAFVFSLSITGFISNAKESNSNLNSYKYYTSIAIMPGDTLSSIASNYYDSHFKNSRAYIDEVKIINNLEDDAITAGMNLIIPYYSSEFKE